MWQLASAFAVAFSAIFFVVDPLGVVPIFLAITAGAPPQKLRSMALRACTVACGLLIFFALFGGFLFRVLGVTLGAFKVAGGILLLISALDLLRNKDSGVRTSPEETQEGREREDVALVPLAIPLLAGPGAIASCMVLMSRGQGATYTALVLGSIVLTFVASYLVLRSATYVQRVLQRSGIAILHRVMGLILAAIAVQFMADGAKDLLRLGT